MKCLSINEPYAHMIYAGLKTIETRTWKTNYRGKILLHCSKKPKGKYGLEGNIFAICDLVDCRPMSLHDIAKAKCEVYAGAYSWVLEKINNIELIPIKGQLSLFEVDIDERTIIRK